MSPAYNLLERLAALEHEQWAHWAHYMLDPENQTPANIGRWHRQSYLDYGDLTESEKESGRIWARKVISAIQEFS